MAKVGPSLPPSAIPTHLRNSVVFKRYGTARRAHFNNPINATNSALFLAYRIKFETALASWKSLTFWKRQRWSNCAIVTRQSGVNLYIKESISQNVTPPKQPISPCSARVTDPNASPWNYAP